MIAILPAPDHVAAYRLSGTLTQEDVDQIIADVEARLARHERIGIVADLTDFYDLSFPSTTSAFARVWKICATPSAGFSSGGDFRARRSLPTGSGSGHCWAWPARWCPLSRSVPFGRTKERPRSAGRGISPRRPDNATAPACAGTWQEAHGPLSAMRRTVGTIPRSARLSGSRHSRPRREEDDVRHDKISLSERVTLPAALSGTGIDTGRDAEEKNDKGPPVALKHFCFCGRVPSQVRKAPADTRGKGGKSGG